MIYNIWGTLVVGLLFLFSFVTNSLGCEGALEPNDTAKVPRDMDFLFPIACCICKWDKLIHLNLFGCIPSATGICLKALPYNPSDLPDFYISDLISVDGITELATGETSAGLDKSREC